MLEPIPNLNSTDHELWASLRKLLRGRVCIVGVGNRYRGDDGAGPSVIDNKSEEARGVWIDAGVAPENYLEPMARTNPDMVLIVDAVDFGGFPGERRLLDSKATDTFSLSTHAGSLDLLNEYLAARSGAQLWVIAIQPLQIELRKELSAPIAKSVRELAEILSCLLASPGSLPQHSTKA